MEKREIKILKILEAFEENPAQTQRDLSKKLKISLGMVNVFMKRLEKKNYFTVKIIPKGRSQYHLTPKGIAEKARLSHQYILYSIQFYKLMRNKMKSLLNGLSDLKKKGVFFYGVSELAEIAFISLHETNIKLLGVIDDELTGNEFMGLTIEGTERLKDISVNDAIILTKIDCSKNDLESLSYHSIGLETVIDGRK